MRPQLQLTTHSPKRFWSREMPYSRKLFLSGATCSKRIHLFHAGSGGGSVIAKIGKPQGFRVYCNTLALLASLILSYGFFAALNPVRGLLEVAWELGGFVSVCLVELIAITRPMLAFYVVDQVPNHRCHHGRRDSASSCSSLSARSRSASARWRSRSRDSRSSSALCLSRSSCSLRVLSATAVSSRRPSRRPSSRSSTLTLWSASRASTGHSVASREPLTSL